MLRNYIKTILRRFRKNKFYTVLNVIGLATGFACVLYISLYINHEITYDQFIPEYEKVFRLSEESYALTSPAHMEYLSENLEEVENYAFLLNSGGFTVGQGTGKILENKAFYATDEFFKVFHYQPIVGSVKDFNTIPNATVITKGFAIKLFGTHQVLDQVITIFEGDQDTSYKIVAVIEDLPTNTHMGFSMIARMPTAIINTQRDNWGYTIYHGYMRLKNEISTTELQQVVSRVFARRALDNNWYEGIKTVDELVASDRFEASKVLRVDEIYLHSNKNFELQAGGNSKYLWVFGGAALFVLLLAIINFINLTTARLANRAKEVGIRKTLGSSRAALVFQFITEAVLLCLIAAVLSCGVVEFFISFLNSYAGIDYSFSLLDNGKYLAALLLGAVFIGTVSGIYPAFYLSSVRPAKVLKGQLSGGENTVFFRNALVVFQFTISLCLGIFMFFIQSQLHYGLEKDPGFDKENLLTIDNSLDQLGENPRTFKNNLLKDTRFVNAGFFNFELIGMSTTMVSPVENKNNIDPFRVYYQWTDASYLPTLDVKFIGGRNFDENILGDTSVMVINETAAKQLGFDNPIGQYLNFGGSPGKFKIIGIVKDFHHQSFDKIVPPTLFVYSKYTAESIMVRLTAGNVSDRVDALKKIWNQHSDQPFNYHFVDVKFQKLFDKEQRLGKVVTLFTCFAFLVACLGLLGLAGYTAEQKTKEIGIRKVLGASVKQIVVMFSFRFAKLVFVAVLGAAPLAYFVTDSWLSSFAYRIQIGFWPFVLVSISGLLIVMLTVSYHMIGAAITNPVESLKDE